MERTDFSKLSDTVIYDKDGRQIGLINAGHYQYVGITGRVFRAACFSVSFIVLSILSAPGSCGWM